MNIFEFMGQNPWQTFFLGPVVLLFVSLTFNLSYQLLKVTLRNIIVLFRGWPPKHLDSDGNWKPSKTDEQ